MKVIEGVEQRVEDLLGKLTLHEKISLLSGKDHWRTVPIERLGIPSLVMTDGPHGVRAPADGSGRLAGPTTCFPTGTSLAATWNIDLIERLGEAIGEEAAAMGCDILLGPTVNIVRHPLAGRNFETYAEDPLLAGRIGVAFVEGVQSKGVGTSVKHYAGNNQEYERFRGDSIVDERTLREIYLAQFETIVKEAKPWTLMCSYNRLNGEYASQNRHLLTEILRQEWGFEGAVVSDWGANHATVESVKAGLDIEMPGPAKLYGRLLMEAVLNRQIDQAVIDESVRRLLRLIVLSGKMDGPAGTVFSANTVEHQTLAREVAEESIVLLKNEGGVLPVNAAAVKSIAIIGPHATIASTGGGGSSFVEPPYRVSPLEALRESVGDRVTIGYEQGCDNFLRVPSIRADYITSEQGGGVGFWGEYFDNTDFTGPPVLARLDQRLAFHWFDNRPAEGLGKRFSVRWTAKLTAPITGLCQIIPVSSGRCRVFLDNQVVADSRPERGSAEPVASGQVVVSSGRAYDLRVEYVEDGDTGNASLRLMFAIDAGTDEAALARAAALAAESDVAFVFAGLPEGYESEGRDRADLELNGDQNALIEAVAMANKNTVVILNSAAPVTMPWIDDVPAVLTAFYAGQEGGNAIANILLGEVNPSGKLAVTFPKRLEDTPAYVNYPGDREVRYGEGLFVGYRYYDRKDVEPLFPFGFGLSYTTFEYIDLQLPQRIRREESLPVTLTVKNTGDRAGSEVVQLYVADKQASLARPAKELKWFAKVALEPGESRTLALALDQRAFAFYDPYRRDWVVEPGEFEILVGTSSRDIRLKALVTLD